MTLVVESPTSIGSAGGVFGGESDSTPSWLRVIRSAAIILSMRSCSLQYELRGQFSGCVELGLELRKMLSVFSRGRKKHGSAGRTATLASGIGSNSGGGCHARTGPRWT